MKKVTAAVLLLLLCLLAGCASAAVSSDRCWYYTVLKDGTARITSFMESTYAEKAEDPEKLVVPAMLDVYQVTEIDSFALYSSDRGFREIVLPKTLRAFSLKEGNDQYYLPVPPSVEAFSVAEGNETFSARDGMLYQGDTLLSCPPAKAIGEDGLVIPDGTGAISNGAFNGISRFSTLRIPASVTSLMKSLIRGEDLDNLVLPDLKEITVDPANPVYHSNDGVLYEGTVLLAYPSGREEALFTVEEGTTAIACGAFIYNANLEEVRLPDSLEAISTEAFYRMYGLKAVNLPAGLARIGDAAFVGCQSMERCALAEGNTLFRMENGALIRNDSDTLIAAFSSGKGIPEGIAIIGEEAYTNCPDSIPKLVIPESVTEIGEECFDGTDVKEVELPSSLRKWDGAFRWCKSLESAVLSEGITEIPEEAFEGCENLRTVTFPGSLTAIGDGAFMFCSKLEVTTIPDGVASIGEAAFCECEAIRTLAAAAGKIGKRAFSSCTGLVEVTFLGEVEEIGESAFSYCKKLKTVTFQGGKPVIRPSAFFFCDGLKTVYFRNCYPQLEGDPFRYAEDAVAVVNNPADSEKIDTGSLKQVREYVAILTANAWKAESSTDPETEAFLKAGGSMTWTFLEVETQERDYSQKNKWNRKAMKTVVNDKLRIRMDTPGGTRTEKEIDCTFDQDTLKMYNAKAVWKVDGDGKLVLSQKWSGGWTITFAPAEP